MEYTRLGRTGLEVSRICVGCMSFGEPGNTAQPWSLSEQDSRPIIRRALEGGINFFDTANVYSSGRSEEIVGRALRDFARRDDYVIATKVHGRMRSGPNGAGLSRRVILSEIDASLTRLGLDHVDLYQIHRWDPETPIEETLEALNDVVRAGKARYIGASSMYAWQFAHALTLSERHGWARFVSMQNYYNLLYREEEREMLPLCLAEGIGAIPWSPLDRGRLVREWDSQTVRTRADPIGNARRAVAPPQDRDVVERVAALARRRGTTRAAVALAWLLSRPAVTAPIVGATRIAHLEEAIAGVDLKLDDEEIAELEAPYVPHVGPAELLKLKG